MRNAFSVVALLLFFGCISDNDLRWKPRQIVESVPTVALARTVTVSETPPESLLFFLPGDVLLELNGVGAGTFVMGTPLPECGNVNRHSRMNRFLGHKVTLTGSFWLAKYEVTQRQYNAMCGDRDFPVKGENLPADGLTWDEARTFVEKMNEMFVDEIPEGYHFELPTEAQWEYACRAGTVSTYNNGKWAELETKCFGKIRSEEFAPVSKGLDEIAWYSANSGGRIHPVGGKLPNAWGFYDMHGNVGEWCLDYFDAYYGNPEVADQFKTPSFILNYVDPAVVFKEGLSMGVYKRFPVNRVCRGGNATSKPDGCTSYCRHPRYATAGIRVALVPKNVLSRIDDSDATVYGLCPVTQELAKNIKQLNARELKIKRLQSALTMMRVAKEVGDVATDVYEEYRRSRSVKAGGGGSSEEGGESGFSTIKGPGTLSYDLSHKNGQSARYSLYVGGKKISDNVEWSAGGTSLSVNSSGRAMARNPPCGKGGRFRTGIRATYKGKTYRKTITIIKR